MTSTRTQRRIGKCRATDLLACAAAIAGPLALYVATMPRTVALEDDGLFLMAGEHLGVAHPPGYPVYTWILHLFMQLPFGTPAFAGHLSSAVLGALACGAVFVCARLLNASVVPALTAALLFGASEHVWAQAIITEVYSFNSLLFFSIYALLLFGARSALRNDARLRAWLAAAVLYGIGLANHWPLIVLATPGLLVLLVPAWKPFLRRLPVLGGLAGTAAALPYAWMLWRSHQDPAISFYGPIHLLRPIEDGHSLLFFLGRRGYAAIDAAEDASWVDRLAYLQWFGIETASALTMAGFVLALLGLIALVRTHRYFEVGSSVLAFLGQSVLLIGLLGFDYDYFWIGTIRPYSLVCYGIVALWLAVGSESALQWLCARLPGNRPNRTGKAAAALAGLAMTFWTVRADWQVNDRSRNDLMQRHAELLFQELPENAIVLVFDDMEVGPLGYFRYVEQRRPDITLLSIQGLVYGNRLYSPFVSPERRTEILGEFVSRADQPVYLLDPDQLKSVCPDCGLRIAGFVAEVLPGGGGSGTVEIRTVTAAEEYFKTLSDREFADAWEHRFRAVTLDRYGRNLGLLLASNNAAALEIAEPLLPFAERTYHATTGMLSTILSNWNDQVSGRAYDLMDQAERLLPATRVTKRERAFFFFLKGLLELKRGNRPEAAAMFNRSVLVSNHAGNQARRELEALGSATARER